MILRSFAIWHFGCQELPAAGCRSFAGSKSSLLISINPTRGRPIVRPDPIHSQMPNAKTESSNWGSFRGAGRSAGRFDQDQGFRQSRQH